MPEKQRVYIPNRGYDIQVKIADLDYSADLNNIRIVSSIISQYQIVFISMLLDPNDIIMERIYGKEPIYLTIRYIGRGDSQAALEEFKFELIHMSSSSSITNVNKSSTDKQKDLKLITFLTIPKKPFNTITTIVNDVYIGMNIKDVISDLISNTKAELVYDTDGENSDPIDQIIIPPATLSNTIRYLDDTFGIYDGASNLGFCQYDNKYYIMNLTKRLSKSQVFTIYHLAMDSGDSKNIIEKCNDGKNFYSYADIGNSFNGNKTFATNGMQIKHIFKPSDSLYRLYEQDMNNICGNYGIISKNTKIDFDSILEERESYKTTLIGNEDSDIVANARLARQIISLSTLNIRLERNLQIMNLMRVGECVKFIPQTINYTDLSGKYILKGSDIMLSKEAMNWVSTASIILCRTNKTI